MQHTRILVLGGSGFVGSHIVARLVNRGLAVTVPARRRTHAQSLILLPTVEAIQADIHDDAVLGPLIERHDAVINLVGILHGKPEIPYGPEFEQAHVRLPRRVVSLCERHGVRRLVHMSALGADPAGPSMYQRSKGDGETAVRLSSLDWTIMRPSVIFGPEDRFLNLFAHLAKWFPILPIGGASAKFQPIFVGDVADAFCNALDNDATYHRAYELGGPRVYTLKELVQTASAAAGYARPVVALPESLARLQALMLEWLPGGLMSRDNLDSMKRDNVVDGGKLPDPELGVSPHFLEAEAPRYLTGQSPRTRLDAFRQRARR